MHKHGGDIYKNKVKLDFSCNTNLLGMPEGVIRAAKSGVDQSHRYPDTQCSELRESISLSQGISKDRIICGNGAADIIFSLVIAKKPKKALLLSPTFYEYEQALQCVECQISYHQLLKKTRFQLQWDFMEKINKDMDIVFLCNPNNPTGTIIEKMFMIHILRKCEECDCLLVVDECFLDFVPEDHTYTLKGSCKESKHLFILKAFTKLYAMPGLRLGFGLCGDSLLLNKMKHTSQPWSVSVPAQLAGIAALKETEYVTESLNIMNEEKKFLIHQLQQLQLQIYGSQANYIFFGAKQGLYKQCLEQGILIRDCSNYRGLTEGYYRIVVKTHCDNVTLIELLTNLLGKV